MSEGREGGVAMNQQGGRNSGRGYGGRVQQGPDRPALRAGHGWQGDGGWGGGWHGDRRRRRRGAYGGAWEQVAPAAGSRRVLPGRPATRGTPRAAAWMASPGGGVAAEAGAGAAPSWPLPPLAVLRLLLGILWLCAHNSHVQFDHQKMTTYHYDVDVRREEDLPTGSAPPAASNPDLSAVKAELFRLYAARFPAQPVAYDGQRNLLSPVLLPEGDFWVSLQGGVFHVTLKLLKRVPLQELRIDVKHVMDLF